MNCKSSFCFHIHFVPGFSFAIAQTLNRRDERFRLLVNCSMKLYTTWSKRVINCLRIVPMHTPFFPPQENEFCL